MHRFIYLFPCLIQQIHTYIPHPIHTFILHPMTTNNNNNNNTLRILCFGNSLTAGYWHWGLEYHPYAIKLKELLQQSLSRDELLLPPDTEIVIDVEGLPGDLAISPPGRFLGRMEGRCTSSIYIYI